MHETHEDLLIVNARRQWRDGEERVLRFTADSKRRMLLERIIDSLSAELTRRIGQTFSMGELASMYDGAETWAQPIVHAGAPEDVWAWDMGVVLDAAFFRFERQALDYTP